jgi:hypothetical protein
MAGAHGIGISIELELPAQLVHVEPAAQSSDEQRPSVAEAEMRLLVSLDCGELRGRELPQNDQAADAEMHAECHADSARAERPDPHGLSASYSATQARPAMAAESA